jgi:protoheme IX farnesyltransferase
LLAASISVFILIILGSVMRVVETGSACPDWPTCFGVWTPPAYSGAWWDYAHRAWSAVTLLIAVWAVATARRSYAENRTVSGAATLGLGVLVGQALFGALLAQADGTAWLSAFHLGLSLTIQGLFIMATVAALYRHGAEATALKYQLPFARWSLGMMAVAFVLMVSGTLVSGMEVGSVCQTWPLCNSMLLPASAGDWLNLAHRFIVLGAALSLAALFWQAWRTQRSDTPVLVSTTAAVVLFFSQALLGARMKLDAPGYLFGLHTATAAGFWAAMVVQVVAVGLSQRSALDEHADAVAARARSLNQLARDLLMLTKPVVVALLLVTTYAGMIIGLESWPSFWLVVWTLLGGFMAAGGSGAINQYIDRHDDLKMQRTQKRPIPSGRLTPGEGLAFGVGISLASFYLMVAMVNLLAALLSLAGIIYYVLIYSIFLKKTTVQNIVIGGGAGAIPPLVGWAAATGSLNIPSLFLFAVVFMWTPPHFWALALVRAKDYARAGVPMLPVIRGEHETRWQILLYTLELVGLTLLLPLFGLGGSVYFVGAALLGLWLISSAWRVWKQGGNKLAWKMYRYSSMYLAFLFIVLVVDALL